MRVVLDNNILFSLMKPDSFNSKLFSIINLGFCAPDFIKKEFEKYEKECFKKSGLDRNSFLKRKREIFSQIDFIEFAEYEHMEKNVKPESPDEDDNAYLALALYLETFIWSNDKDLKKQDLVDIFSTQEMVEILFD